MEVTLLGIKKMDFTTAYRLQFPSGVHPAPGLKLMYEGRQMGEISGHLEHKGLLDSLRSITSDKPGDAQLGIFECTIAEADDALDALPVGTVFEVE